jgi:ligand-binding sensor domain-containing protein
MTKYFLIKPIYSLLVVLVFLTSCNGQVKTEYQSDKDSISTGQFKIPKPQGINKDAGIGSGIQDKDRNLWFGSYGEGLYKFDGKFFIHFSKEQGLNSNTIYSILQDKTGNIWVGTNKGLNRLDGNKFVSIPIVLGNKTSLYISNSNNNNNITPTENAVWSMMQDKNGTIWFGTDDGVYCYKGKEFTRFLDNQTIINKDSLNLKGIFSILEAKNGNIWFAECAGEGVSSFDGKSLSIIIPYKEIGRTDRIIEDKQNNLWFAAAFKGVSKYDGKTFTQNIFKDKQQNGSYNILEDTNGNMWFDRQDGLGFYDGKTLNILTEKDGTTIKDFIPVILDKSGNLWFSSKGMKLYKYDGKTFINYSE